MLNWNMFCKVVTSTLIELLALLIGNFYNRWKYMFQSGPEFSNTYIDLKPALHKDKQEIAKTRKKYLSCRQYIKSPTSQ